MKNKFTTVISIILIIVFPLFSQDIEKNEIISNMEFPLPSIKIGKAIDLFLPEKFEENIDLTEQYLPIEGLDNIIDSSGLITGNNLIVVGEGSS